MVLGNENSFLKAGPYVPLSLFEDQAAWHEWKGHVMGHQENVRMKEKCKSLKEVSIHYSPPVIRKKVIRAQKGRREIIDLDNSYQPHGGKMRYVQ